MPRRPAVLTRVICHAKVKNDRFGARTLAELLAADLIPRVWISDEHTRALRRLTSRRAQLVRQRTRVKNETTAVLVRNLKGRPPATDLFGKRGRRWLASGEIKRLMTIPGTDVTTAATVIAAIGDIRRFESAKHLVGYLGLDARVRQPGVAIARHGRAPRSRSLPSRANSRCSAGSCSPASRTTPTSAPRSSRASCAFWNCAPAHRTRHRRLESDRADEKRAFWPPRGVAEPDRRAGCPTGRGERSTCVASDRGKDEH